MEGGRSQTGARVGHGHDVRSVAAGCRGVKVVLEYAVAGRLGVAATGSGGTGGMGNLGRLLRSMLTEGTSTPPGVKLVPTQVGERGSGVKGALLGVRGETADRVGVRWEVAEDRGEGLLDRFMPLTGREGGTLNDSRVGVGKLLSKTSSRSSSTSAFASSRRPCPSCCPCPSLRLQSPTSGTGTLSHCAVTSSSQSLDSSGNTSPLVGVLLSLTSVRALVGESGPVVDDEAERLCNESVAEYSESVDDETHFSAPTPTLLPNVLARSCVSSWSS